MAMTRRASICLSLLALLSSFPLSLGEASHISGSSLIGVSSVSEILDQFFKNQEMSGRKVPVWKSEAQAMISLVQSMKDINATTQAKVDDYVQKIIALLESDMADEVAAQKTAQDALELWKTSSLTPALQSLTAQLTKVKTRSSNSKTCRGTVTTLKTEYLTTHGCTNTYLPSAGLSSASLMQADTFSQAGSCPTECGKPSQAEFELNADAKMEYECDFEAGQTAEQCVDLLWAKVNMTRQNLTNKYNAWAAKKAKCEAEMAQCAKCNPLWSALQLKNTSCNDKRKELYDSYCDLQEKQTGFCGKNETLYGQTATAKTAQTDRVKTYSDLDFITCIFKKYLEIKNFTVPMIQGCTKKTAAEYYAATTPGEITLPTVNAAAVPACYGAVSHTSTSPLFDMTGLIDEIKLDNYGTTVSVTDKVYAPAAGTGSVFCTALTS